MGAYDIKLPAFLHVAIENGDRPRNSYWRAPVPQFIVLKFGDSEIGRWEWEGDRPLSMRRELELGEADTYDVTDFVAAKIRELLFPTRQDS